MASSTATLNEQGAEKASLESQNRFTIAAMEAIHASSFAQGFSDDVRKSAIRAILRHAVHEDGMHYHTKTPGGLHPAYIGFNPASAEAGPRGKTPNFKRALVEAHLQDVFDAVTMQDRLDGGISLLIRCPGFDAGPDIAPDKVTMDLYVTPRELLRNERVSGDTAVLVQAFCQEFVIPHLQRFIKRCNVESMQAPSKPHLYAEPVSLKGPNHLPVNANPLVSRIQCTAFHPATAATDMATDDARYPSPSAAIYKLAGATPKAKKVTSRTLTTPSANMVESEAMPETLRHRRQPRPADAFLLSSKEIFAAAKPLMVSSDSSPPGSALISIGFHSDAVLEWFKLGDDILPRLHKLITTVRSSRWEAVLVAAPWNMSREQAFNLSRALSADLKGSPDFAIVTRPPPMVSQSFTTTKQHRIQPPRLPRAKVTLSADARAALKLDRQHKSEQFYSDLGDALDKLDETTKTLASKHKRSVRFIQNNLTLGHAKFCNKRNKINAWNAFCWKKHQTTHTKRNVLPDLVTNHKLEYSKLSADEKQRLVEEFSDFRLNKTTGTRVTMRSKVNDVTHTIKSIELELDNLRCRTGVETILYAARGTTSLPLRGVAFATDGVEDFMPSVMGVDKQEMVSKMEGYAVQGVRGAAKNHQERVSQLRGQVREIINRKLREITGDSNAKMQWKYYFRNIVASYKVMIKGWPSSLPFVNLSDASSSYSQLDTLLRRWEAGSTHWETVSDLEFENLRRDRNQQIEAGEIEDPGRRPRSDKGTKRRHNQGDNPQHNKKHKSTVTVDDDDNESSNEGLPAEDQHTSHEPADLPHDSSTAPPTSSATATTSSASPVNGPTATNALEPSEITATPGSTNTSDESLNPGNDEAGASGQDSAGQTLDPGNDEVMAGASGQDLATETLDGNDKAMAGASGEDSAEKSLDPGNDEAMAGANNELMDELVSWINIFDGAAASMF
ncbi:hypothetical protein JVT61DRAFT_8828 [Boletus reticuloceps]|uniref:Uncharacterized protein n=1 Tax=Boletus reticuloceps TaxID=495285 RepID=A0A8I2YH22_9AGAM|nr:hypothetical protein JVT61DRAFT_8828 [Boletus reticuloceps]